MIFLSITTSQSSAECAIIKDGSLLRQEKCPDYLRHSSTLAPTCDKLFSDFNLIPSDCNFIAVDVGPGSFTGVRIGVAFANGLSAAISKPVIGVSSLLALRYQARELGVTGPIASVIDAKNNNLYAAIYDENGKELLPASALTYNEFLDQLRPGLTLIGSGALAYHDKLSAFFERAIGQTGGISFIDKDFISVNSPAKEPVKNAAAQLNAVKAQGVGSVAIDIFNQTDDKSVFSCASPMYLKPSQAEMNRPN